MRGDSHNVCLIFYSALLLTRVGIIELLGDFDVTGSFIFSTKFVDPIACPR